MAITGIDTIEGKQIIAAGAVSAKSAGMAYNDENGNPITGYLTAVPEGYATTGDLTAYQTTAGMTAYQSAGDYLTTADSSNFLTAVPETYLQNTNLTITDGKVTEISGVPLSAGSAPTYGYTDNSLISAIDSSGLYASSGSANHLNQDGTMGGNVTQSSGSNYFYYMPQFSPWTTADVATGIFSPLQYATGACLAMDAGYFKAYFKGNEWYVCNTSIGQALRGEVHASRSVHISGATTKGYNFDLSPTAVRGIANTANHSWLLNANNVTGSGANGSWIYGPAEDAALRAVSSCDMHESAFSYDASDNITGYNGSAFKVGDEFPQSATEAIETVTANSGAWGGSALPISAGPGIKFEMVGDTLVASTDETVLYDNSVGASAMSFSESLSSFERVLVYGSQENVGEWGWTTLLPLGNSYGVCFTRFIGGNNPCQIGGGILSVNSNHTSGSLTGCGRRWLPLSTAAGGSDTNQFLLKKVVGINRIAGV